MRKRLLVFLMLLALLLPSLFSCAPNQTSHASFFLMDTAITVTLYEKEETAAPILAECRSMLTELDRLWSRTKGESDTSRFNASGVGEVEADRRTLALLRVALDVSEKTNGAFDVTVAPLVTLWQSCERAERLPTDAELQAALERIGSEQITVTSDRLLKNREGTEIDLGGIGKGAAISEVVSYIKGTGVSALVSFGSNVAAVGKKPNGADFRIAIRDPKDRGSTVGTVTLSDGDILSVSGDYERFYTVNGEKYHHILDTKTGYPSKSGLSSVAVICKDGALADALSTALLVMGEVQARTLYASEIYDFEAVFVTDTGIVSTTDGISLN